MLYRIIIYIAAGTMLGIFIWISIGRLTNVTSSPDLSWVKTTIAEENDPYRLARKGVALAKTNNFEAAEEAFTKVTQLDPKWRDGFVWLGYAKLKLNKPKDALAVLKTAETLDPVYSPTYELLTVAYEQTGDKTSADFARSKAEMLAKNNL